jgi:aminoglycoside phosphotransferase (APT) family kinase protein
MRSPDPRQSPRDGKRGTARRHLHPTPATSIEPDLVDEQLAASVWRAAVDAPAWPGPGVWVHRDLTASNLITVEGRLSGVLDFGGVAVGHHRVCSGVSSVA